MQPSLIMIEDDTELATMLCDFLKRYNINVTSFEDPYLGISALNLKSYDLLILDLSLPGMDGLEICKEVRAKSDIPIIISSARSDLDDKVIALDRYYNKNIESMERFVNWAKDTDLNLKYLVRYATQKGKLMSPSNTDAYYYNQVLLGKNLNETVLYLKDETNAEAQAIKRTLEKEIKD